jgi:hypothetical protein
MTGNVQLKKITGHESQGACHQDELIGGKLPVVKFLMVMTVSTTIKRKYLRVETKTNVDMCLTYLM